MCANSAHSVKSLTLSGLAIYFDFQGVLGAFSRKKLASLTVCWQGPNVKGGPKRIPTHMKTQRHLKTVKRLASTFVLGMACLLRPSTDVYGIAGLEGTFEFGLDAPWRIEPVQKLDGTLDYGAIPIQITIQDAQHARFDNIIGPFPSILQPGGQVGGLFTIALPPTVTSLGLFHSIRIKELGPVETQAVEFPLHALHEIELNGDWAFPHNASDGARPPHTHRLCRVWKGENPEPFRDVSKTAEWHGTLWYVPQNKSPGTSVALQIEVLLRRAPWPPKVEYPASELIGPSPFLTLRNYVRVHLAAAPLPRFDERWLYGDLHYHSQGTDNEGESGYNYRGVIRAMGAMGMDFAFATDHASNSEQLVDADLKLNLLEEFVGGLAGWLGLPGGDDGDSLEDDDVSIPFRGFLRDMDAARYRHSHGLIYGNAGANKEASFRASAGGLPQNYRSYGVVPQIFLGGELDAIPEVKRLIVGELPVAPPSGSSLPTYLNYIEQLENWRPNRLPYGNKLSFDLKHMRDGGVEPVYQLFEPAGDVYLIRDFQGLNRYDLYGRQHLVYFPASSSLNVGAESSFISSSTSEFGGATRRLTADHNGKPALLPEIERKGVAFVAHHLNACGQCDKGPDGIPWTADHMLYEAYRSPAILGLQFWNENGRFNTAICSHSFCRDDQSYGGHELGYERAENPSIAGYVPDELRNVGLPLAEYRQGFLAPGGTEGGLFELIPFDVVNGTWQSRSQYVEHTLHHGAHDWDKMNLRGLDFERNRALSWLPAGEPRRMLMGGGSDAHGDLNYRRAGYFLGTDDANDTAIGKPRNLVFAGRPEGPVLFKQLPLADSGILDNLSDITLGTEPVKPPIADLSPIGGPAIKTGPPTRKVGSTTPPGNSGTVRSSGPAWPVLEPAPSKEPPTKDSDAVGSAFLTEVRAHTQEQIIRALRQGRYCVTDGPALRMAIDLNGNQQIDDSDIQMGAVHSIARPFLRSHMTAEQKQVTLLVEVMSTPEFGPISKVDLYVGVHPGNARAGNGVLPQTRVYAPERHGVRADTDPKGARSGFAGIGDSFHRVLPDGYWEDNRLKLVPAPGSEYHFTAAVVLDLESFEAGVGVIPDRFFVRAFASTKGDAAAFLPDRYAFSNPIWICRRIQMPIDPEQIIDQVLQPAP